MNIYWEEHDSADENPKHWSEDEISGTIALTEVLTEAVSLRNAVSLRKTLPTAVGGYDITGGNGIENSFVFNFVKKPNWFHRTCTRFFLGWKWNDI